MPSTRSERASGRFSGAQLRLGKKVPLAIIGGAAVAAITVGIITYLDARTSLKAATDAKLEAVLGARHAALSNYLDSIRADLRFQHSNPMVHEALGDFIEGWQALGDHPTQTLQTLYIEDNPHPTGQKENLDAASDGSAYSEAHARHHPWMRHFLRERGYYDIFLFDPDGNLVYTVFKELDYATNLVSGNWAGSDLGHAFRAARDSAQVGHQAFFDFQPYAPSHDAPASFIATPMLDEHGGLSGVLAFQMPIGELNALMQQVDGLGETGETYIVGDDLLMRSDSRFSADSTILARRIDTEPARAVVAGEVGAMTANDYRGVPVVSAFAPLEFLGTRWGILAEQDVSEALAAVVKIRNNLLLEVSVVLAVLAGLGMLIGRSISRPIVKMTMAMRTIASGDNTIEVPSRERRDEIGEMAQAVQVFKDNAIRMEQMRADQEQAEKRAEEEKRATMHRLADAFEAKVGHVVRSVSAASTQMRTTAQSLSAISEETTRQSTMVASAAEQASANVETVASAAEELGSSIGEISQQVQRQADMAEQAAAAAESSNQQVQGLTDRADTIGEVVNLITGIAEQTNLLALNATIEAARAGDAGKGFAVVASEVKSLATQTAKATEQIAAQIKDVQDQTGSTVDVLHLIDEKIAAMKEVAVAIASAIEEQNAATQEIGRNAQEASVGTRAVSGAIGDVTKAAGEAGQGSSDVLAAARELSQQAEVLSSEVAAFINQVRAA